MYPGTYAAEAPDRVAAVMADTGETLTYGELEERSVRLAHVLHDAGLRPGRRRSPCSPRTTCAPSRSTGPRCAPGSTSPRSTTTSRRTRSAYIVNDCGATALIVSAEPGATGRGDRRPRPRGVKLRLAFGGPVAGYDSYEDALAAASDEPFADQPSGLHHALLLGHHRPAQGHPAAAARPPGRRARRWPWPALASSVRLRRGHGLPLARRRSTTRRRCAGRGAVQASAAPWS